MKRPALFACFGLLPLLSGCITPNGPPSLDTPRVKLQPPNDEDKAPTNDGVSPESNRLIFQLNPCIGPIALDLEDWTNRFKKDADDPSFQECFLFCLYGSCTEGGSVSADHRKWLLFGASQYDRLSNLTKSTEQHERLIAMARALRDLAAQ